MLRVTEDIPGLRLALTGSGAARGLACLYLDASSRRLTADMARWLFLRRRALTLAFEDILGMAFEASAAPLSPLPVAFRLRYREGGAERLARLHLAVEGLDQQAEVLEDRKSVV